MVVLGLGILFLPLMANLLLIANSKANTEPEFCNRGQFLHMEHMTCRPCPHDHFMPDYQHTQARCYPCYDARRAATEIEVEACTNTSDTVIGCIEDHFLHPAASDDPNLIKCYPCTICPQTDPPTFEIRACGKIVDTVCCQDPSMVAVQNDGESEYHCQDAGSTSDVSRDAIQDQDESDNRAKPQMDQTPPRSERSTQKDETGKLECGQGQFLNKAHRGNEKCENCPDNTYMSEKKHYNTRCVSCTATPKNRQDIYECTKTSFKLVACHKGYHLFRTVKLDPDSAECKRCRKDCMDDNMNPFIGRRCSNDSDTLCCPRKNMVAYLNKDGDSLDCRDVETTPRSNQTGDIEDICKEYTNSSSQINNETDDISGKSIKNANTSFEIGFYVSIGFNVLFIIYFIWCRCKKRRGRSANQERQDNPDENLNLSTTNDDVNDND